MTADEGEDVVKVKLRSDYSATRHVVVVKSHTKVVKPCWLQMEERRDNIPTAFVREGVGGIHSDHLCCNCTPVQSLEFVLVNDGEEQVAIGFSSPGRGHDGDDDCELGLYDCKKVRGM